MDSQKVLADFQMLGNRVSKFSIEIKSIDTRGKKVDVNYDIDYDILKINEEEERFVGLLEFIVNIKAKVKNSILFKVNLKIEGLFIGNSKILTIDQFKNMLELNGVATLSHLSRSFIISTSALAGLNPPIKLPMINIHSLKKFKHKKQKDNANSNIEN